MAIAAASHATISIIRFTAAPAQVVAVREGRLPLRAHVRPPSRRLERRTIHCASRFIVSEKMSRIRPR